MQNIINNQYIIAVFIARIFLGFLFFFQGYDVIVRVGIKNLIERLHLPLGPVFLVSYAQSILKDKVGYKVCQILCRRLQ